MTNGAMNLSTCLLGMPGFAAMQEEYWRDAFERSALFLDVLRQRGSTYVERTEERSRHDRKIAMAPAIANKPIGRRRRTPHEA
jgi:hypothetical protein